MLQDAGKDPELGKHWTTKFFSRHPQLRTLQGKRIEIERVKGILPDELKVIFEPLNGPLNRSNRPLHRRKFDETGLTEGHRFNGKVIRPVKTSNGKSVRYASQRFLEETWVTIIGSITKYRRQLTISLLLLFSKGKQLEQHFPKEFKMRQFTILANGLTSNELFYSG